MTGQIVFVAASKQYNYKELGEGNMPLSNWIWDPKKDDHEVRMHGELLAEFDYEKYVDVSVRAVKLNQSFAIPPQLLPKKKVEEPIEQD